MPSPPSPSWRNYQHVIGQRVASVLKLLAIVLLLVCMPACTSAEHAAQDTYELAEFEQKQGNADHARQLYQEIVTKYSGTQWAEKARASLDDLPAPHP